MTNNKGPDPRMDMARIPRHVAIIMDGNGRWAKRTGQPRSKGHEAGARNVREITEACRELGVKALSLFAFSTENWRRSKREVDSLFNLMTKSIKRYSDQIHKTNVRLLHMGLSDGLPAEVAGDIQKCVELTRNNTAMDVCIALNYGGRRELTDAARKIARQVQQGELRPEDITEETLAAHLYLPGHSEVDLLIRTSGENRISNFMLWQISYAEIVVTPTLWPDFNRDRLHETLVEYQSRNRRFGGRP
ncbi:MAG TPA: polyprenyl diphosphate synthase [Candidatus Hydrogenedentes bacterium]|nr:MAG: Ditrans,polycis-undecaprenyl-diphosphate synthase ((2E,6E)-farnesyl-diphosphate specific) [Candidatus Hydrogenedentes bacterium ADurb.Bin101]HOC68506.1 polyprenyl diphosphate synthase [Candidatus Hydrogenedentota bacterium]HQM99983.1 polyprenyl diphosphate synthase [Candidatus Hydrogenedentota bacterium]